MESFTNPRRLLFPSDRAPTPPARASAHTSETQSPQCGNCRNCGKRHTSSERQPVVDSARAGTHQIWRWVGGSPAHIGHRTRRSKEIAAVRPVDVVITILLIHGLERCHRNFRIASQLRG